MRISRLLLAVVFAGCLTTLSVGSAWAAPAGGVSGIIKDANGVPLAGVAVTLFQGPFNSRVIQTATTDYLGRFEMKGLLPGLYSLKADLASYIPLIRSGIGIAAGKIADLNLILENLYLQSVLGASAGGARGAAKEDIESVLRTASSTRPILRVFDADAGDSRQAGTFGDRGKSGIRGVVGFSTSTLFSVPELASSGTTFTDFAFIKDLNASTTWVVAGVVSDSGFAEVDSLVRLRDTNRHSTSVRLSLGILPYLADSLSPLMSRNVHRLNMYNLDIQDEIKLSEMLSVIYGTELQLTDPNTGATRFRPRWGMKFRPTAASGFTFIRTSSLPQKQKTLDLGEGDSLELASPFQHEFGNRLNFGLNRVTHTEASSEQVLGTGSHFSVGVYTDDFARDRMLFAAGDGRPSFNSARGVRFAYKRSLAGSVESTVGYTYGSGIRANRDYTELTPRNYHVVAARVKSAIPVTHTQFAATYRWISGDSLTIIDPYQDIFDTAAPGVSLIFAQALPYFGRFIPGRLEAELELRNLLANGNSELFQSEFYESARLRRVEFLQPARSVRGGIKLKF